MTTNKMTKMTKRNLILITSHGYDGLELKMLTYRPLFGLFYRITFIPQSAPFVYISLLRNF